MAAHIVSLLALTGEEFASALRIALSADSFIMKDTQDATALRITALATALEHRQRLLLVCVPVRPTSQQVGERGATFAVPGVAQLAEVRCSKGAAVLWPDVQRPTSRPAEVVPARNSATIFSASDSDQMARSRGYRTPHELETPNRP